MRGVETVLFLVVVATVVAAFARRLRVPAPSLLVVAGIIVGVLPGVPTIQVTPEVVSLVVLPPLLYAAGEELPWRDLRAVWKPVTALAVGLVFVTAAVVAALVVALVGLPVGMAMVLGTTLASTDPVAVTALGRKLSLPPRVQALVQAESLFNDATSLLLFRIAVSLAVATGALSAGHIALQFLLLAGGGAVVGIVMALGVMAIRRHTEDPVLDTVTALVTPYATYVLAESFGASGVTAVVVAGVVVGTSTPRLTNARIRLQLGAVWQTVVFLLESVVFALIGLELPTLIRNLSSSDSVWVLQALAITAALIVIRALWVFPQAAWRRRRATRRAARRASTTKREAGQAGGEDWRTSVVVSWTGARGVVPLAAALSIPLTTSSGAPLEDRDLVLLLTIAVIVITLIVQGFTLAPLVRWAGIAIAPADVRHEESVALLHTARAGLEHLEELADLELASDVMLEQLRAVLRSRIDRLEAEDGIAAETVESAMGPSSSESYRRLRRELLDVQSGELARLYDTGMISESTRRRLQRGLDLEEASLGDE
ncbi:MAG TPA: Na+/H+ antiporter [Pseudonocardiaceae bacterium]